MLRQRITGLLPGGFHHPRKRIRGPMALPRKLKHLNIFNAGNNWMGIAESVTLPEIHPQKLENYRGGGTCLVQSVLIWGWMMARWIRK